MIEAGLLTQQELPALAALWSRALPAGACPLTAAELTEYVLLHGGEPRAILAVDPQGWLVARGEGHLLGFAHCTVGRLPEDDAETLRGVLRALVLAPDAPAATYQILLRAAAHYFGQQRALSNILAFHLHTGYPRLNHGRGTVQQDDWALMTALGEAGYRLTQRWLFYRRDFSDMIEEPLPDVPGLSLRWQASVPEQFTLSAWAGPELAARAQFMLFPQPPTCPAEPGASLFDLQVMPKYQQRHMGRWLLARGVNHLIARGITHLFEAVPHDASRMQERLRALNFTESSQRGYSYEQDPLHS